MKELVLATNNPGKIKELEHLLDPIHCIPQIHLNISPAEETGLSFIENAILKARHAANLSQKPALADDSGLIVPALHGQPGIYSSRFSGANATDSTNIHKLLKLLEDTPDEQRGACFYCVIAVVRYENDPAPLIATGQVKGFITRKLTGEEGFGYDSVFYIPTLESTAAQLPLRIKNQISHRAKALKKIKKLLN